MLALEYVNDKSKYKRCSFNFIIVGTSPKLVQLVTYLIVHINMHTYVVINIHIIVLNLLFLFKVHSFSIKISNNR